MASLGARESPRLLEVNQELVPTLLTLAITIDHSNQLLLSSHRRAHQHEQALPLIGLIFQTHVDVDAVRPNVRVLFFAELATAPLVVLLAPLLLEPHDHVGAETRGVFSEK